MSSSAEADDELVEVVDVEVEVRFLRLLRDFAD